MKLILTILLTILSIKNLTHEENTNLTDLAKKLYTLEDKIDHLLYHFSHDVTRHEYQATPFGTFLAPMPKNPNSIHQKLKLIDHLNIQMGHPGAIRTAANNAYDMELGAPAMAIPKMNRNGSMGVF